ncbi:MAG: hypothetical protein ACAH65_02495 [Chloroflexota bacterium]
MARAKRTDRAEARRRHRSEQALAGVDVAALDAPQVEATTTARPAPGATTAVRPGFATAFREAFRPLDIRADLRALPSLVRHRALWIPVLLTIVSALLFIVVRPGESLATAQCGLDRPGDCFPVLVTFLFQYFIVTPAIGGVFIAGFMAPRASWLLGLIVGLVAATAYSFLVLNGYIVLAPNAETQTQAQDVVFASYLMSPIVGAFFASTAAWYRRFLYLSNPNRGRGRPGAPTRPDGRTRARSANQKASARR